MDEHDIKEYALERMGIQHGTKDLTWTERKDMKKIVLRWVVEEQEVPKRTAIKLCAIALKDIFEGNDE